MRQRALVLHTASTSSTAPKVGMNQAKPSKTRAAANSQGWRSVGHCRAAHPMASKASTTDPA